MSIARSLLAAILLIALGSAAADDDPHVEEALEALVQEINTIEKWLGGTDAALQDLQDQLELSDEQVSQLGIRLFEAREEVENTELLIWELELQAQKLREDRVVAWQLLSVQFRNAYHVSQTDPFKLLLNQEDPDALTRLLKYYEYYNRALANQIASFTRIEKDLRETIGGLAAVRDRLLERVQELELSRARFLDRREARQQEITEYSREIDAVLDISAQLEENRQTLTSVVETLEVQRPLQLAMPNLATSTREGRFWPVDGRVLTSFGEALAAGRLATEGVFVEAAPGTPVYSAADGSVVFSDWIRGIGLLLVIDHGNSHMSLYGSCDSLFKGLGERVEGGEPVGLVGQSGGQSNVGLYFEIRRGGRPLDPNAWLGTKRPSL